MNRRITDCWQCQQRNKQGGGAERTRATVAWVVRRASLRKRHLTNREHRLGESQEEEESRNGGRTCKGPEAGVSCLAEARSVPNG